MQFAKNFFSSQKGKEEKKLRVFFSEEKEKLSVFTRCFHLRLPQRFLISFFGILSIISLLCFDISDNILKISSPEFSLQFPRFNFLEVLSFFGFTTSKHSFPHFI